MSLSPKEVVERMRVPVRNGATRSEQSAIYVLGCLQRPLTFHSQQQRAFNLIWALVKNGLIDKKKRTAIIGAGLAGVTATAAALLNGIPITLIEKNALELDLQTGNTTRYVHPNLYDWPHEGAENEETNLPCLNWRADEAGAVIREVRRQWNLIREQIEPGLLRVITKCEINTLKFEDEGIRVASDLQSLAQGHDEKYDCVILAVGFGLEKGLGSVVPMESYWANVDLRPALMGLPDPCRVLVTGCGDGALTDVLRLRIHDFEHSKLHSWLGKSFAQQLIDIDTQALGVKAGSQSTFLYDEYRKLKIGDDLYKKPNFRDDTVVVLNGINDHPYELGASILNRFALFLLQEVLHDHGLIYRRGEIGASCVELKERDIFRVSVAKPKWELDFHKIIVRHGAVSALARSFPEVAEACTSLTVSGPDPMRWPLYGDFFSSRWRSMGTLSVRVRAASTRNNLPEPMDTIVGRDAFLDRARKTLRKTRLLTLAGPGGAGKTTVAIELARQCLDLFPDGAWLVSLGALSNAASIPQALAAALGLREFQSEDVMAVVTQVINGHSVLLVFDNCEHLGTDADRFIKDLLSSCKGLKIIATTREVRTIPGQKVLRVPLLPCPNLRKLPNSLAQLENYDAVKLFVDRASKVSGFVLDDQNAPLVASICKRLDGLPLAIVLAAGRTYDLHISQIAAGLDDRFRLLTNGGATGLPQHETLRAAVEWSYNLLVPLARRLLLRLSVFSGEWDLSSGRTICAADPIQESDFAELHGRLVRASLIDRSPLNPQRYRLLETTRHYCHDIFAGNERDQFELRHFEYFLGIAENARQSTGTDAILALHGIEADYDNMRGALQRMRAGPVEKYLKLVVALVVFWLRRGQFSEGRQWLEDALQHAGDQYPSERASLLTALATIAYRQGDYGASRNSYQEAITRFEQLKDVKGEVEARVGLARLAREEGNQQEARERLEVARKLAESSDYTLGLARALKDIGIVYSDENDIESARKSFLKAEELSKGEDLLLGMILNNRGVVERNAGDYELALKLHNRALKLMEAVTGSTDLSLDYYNIGIVWWHKGDLDQARKYHLLALDNGYRVGDKRAIALALEGIGRVWAREAVSASRAVILFGVADNLRTQIKSPVEPNERRDYEQSLQQARDLLGQKEFDKTMKAGHQMPLEKAIDLCKELETSK